MTYTAPHSTPVDAQFVVISCGGIGAAAKRHPNHYYLY
jgi:hypothetical protein